MKFCNGRFKFPRLDRFFVLAPRTLIQTYERSLFKPVWTCSTIRIDALLFLWSLFFVPIFYIRHIKCLKIVECTRSKDKIHSLSSTIKKKHGIKSFRLLLIPISFPSSNSLDNKEILACLSYLRKITLL